MHKIFTSTLAILLVAGAMSAADYTGGAFMLNEGWFGHGPGSLNYIDAENNVHYNVYQAKNEGKSFGNTSQYGQVYGDLLLVMSKQTYATDSLAGGRLVVLDATTMESLASINELPSGDGRAVCAVSDKKAYVSTSAGLYAFDLEKYEFSETQLAHTDGNEVGEMIRYGKYVYAVESGSGILAIDVETDEVTFIELASVVAPIVTADGNLYFVTSDSESEFVLLDRETNELTAINIEGEHTINTGWAWAKSAIAADINSNTVYYCAKGGWTITTVSSYNFDTKEFVENYITLPGTADGLEYGQEFYGAGISVDPATGELILIATESGYGSHYENNWVYFVDTTKGEIDTEKAIALDPYYWFPAMMIHNNFTAPEVIAQNFELIEGDTCAFDVAEATTLAAGNKHLVLYSIESSDENVLTFTETGNGKYTATAVATGTATATITAEYQGRTTTTEVTVIVKDLSGIDNVTVDNEEVPEVFNLQGVSLGRRTDLPAGFYIINGKVVKY